MKHEYYFEISKHAMLAMDENGVPSEAYVSASFNSDQTYYTEQQMLEYVAKLSQIPVEHLRMIDKEEYVFQTEEQDA